MYTNYVFDADKGAQTNVNKHKQGLVGAVQTNGRTRVNEGQCMNELFKQMAGTPQQGQGQE